MSDIHGTMPVLKDRTRKARPQFAPATEPRQERARKSSSSPLLFWLPVSVGVALALMAPWLQQQLAAYEPWGMWIVFPFVRVAGLHEIGLSDELTRTLPQLMLYLQFPLEGLLTGFTLSRGGKLTAAVGQILSLHAVCVIVLWLVGGNLPK
ncbi:MAG: hypothetical protein WCE75_11315 [Terracidiphilus sp.]